MRKRMLRYAMTSVLAVACLACASCIHVSGQSSGKMKKELQRSYLVQSAKRFFPEGTVPNDPGLVSPELKGEKLKPIQKELTGLASALRELHATKRPMIEQLGLTLVPKVATRIVVVNGGTAAAATQANGVITVDARVLQSIFRGAVLDVHRRGGSSSLARSFARPEETFDESADPRTATEEQKKAITDLLDTVRKIDDVKGRTMVGDLVGIVGDEDFDSPWFQMADIAMTSRDLQTRYLGAVLFLLAHEQGHLALNHFAKRDELDRSASGPDSEAAHCAGMRLIEQEADAYALLLLSPHTAASPEAAFAATMFEEFNDIVGFRNFFAYGYNLSGFAEENGTSCSYETNRERYESLQVVDEALRERSAEALSAAFEEAAKRAFDPEKKQESDQ